jgi:hypothetical protein
VTSPLHDAASELTTFCRGQHWRFCIIGGLAYLRWGDPRATRDVDITVLTGFGGEAGAARALLAQFSPRIGNPLEFAIRNRVLLLSASNGVPLDVTFGALPFEERLVERSSDFDFGGFTAPTCSAEDLVVMKVFAGRTQDWADVEGIIDAQASSLDVGLIFEELTPLLELKEESESLGRLRHILESA